MKTFLLGTLFTNLSPSNQKIGTTSDDASAETLSNVVTKSDFNVILLTKHQTFKDLFFHFS